VTLATLALATMILTGCTSQPLPQGPSDAEVAQYYSDFSDARWEAMGFGDGIERPVIVDPQPISRDLWASRMASCMNGAGYASYSEQGGGLTVTGTDPAPDQSALATAENATQERLAMYTCQELYPVVGEQGEVFSTAQLRYIYGYYVRFLVPCLESRGYTIDDVPPRDAFLEQGNIGVWNPYWGAFSQNADELAALQVACPPMPPGMVNPYR